MARTLRVLASRRMNAAEWHYLNRLAETMGQLRDLLDAAEDAITTSDTGQAAAARFAQMRPRAETLLGRLTKLNVRIGQQFDMQTYDLESKARWFGQLSQNISQAIFAVALMVSSLVVFLTHRAIVQPISKLVEQTGVLARGDLRGRVDVPPGGEFRTLAESFNRMAAALETKQKQLIEAEKMATIGRFAAGIAHEINNPVAVILGYVKTLLAKTSADAPHREGLEAIAEEAQQCKNIVQGLLNLARPPTGRETELINPSELLSEVVNLAHMLRLTEKVRVRIAVPDEPVPLKFSRSRLRQVTLNIVSNAASRTTAPASPRKTSPTCSSLSSQPSRAAPAWAWP